MTFVNDLSMRINNSKTAVLCFVGIVGVVPREFLSKKKKNARQNGTFLREHVRSKRIRTKTPARYRPRRLGRQTITRARPSCPASDPPTRPARDMTNDGLDDTWRGLSREKTTRRARVKNRS